MQSLSLHLIFYSILSECHMYTGGSSPRGPWISRGVELSTDLSPNGVFGSGISLHLGGRFNNSENQGC